MSQPKAPGSLENSCAAIFENTLYVHTPDSFQSIELKQGAKWKKLSKATESVTGAACVGGPSDFWVVGGTGGSTGLQKFTYSSGKWSVHSTVDPLAKDRQNHSATYIQATNVILVIGDSTTQDGAAGIMEAFTISMGDDPLPVKSFDTGIPNSGAPVLLNWSDADAVMVGVGNTKAQVFLFNPTVGWRDSGASLAEPLTKDRSEVEGALIQGEDGSQNLYLFDLSESPNKVSRVVLSDANGQAVTNSPSITERSLDGRQTEDDWPSYNSTLAPEVKRTNFGIAQNADGMVVLAGGNTEEPLSLFNAKENSWLDADDFLVTDTQKIKSHSSTSSHTSTKTSSSKTSSSTSASSTVTSAIASTTAETTATDTSEPTVGATSTEKDDGNGLSSNVILGITLGTIFAFMLVLALILFLLRRRKLKRNNGAAAVHNKMPDNEKTPSGPITTTPADLPSTVGHFRGHRPTGSAESYSSMAILMGRVNQPKPSGLPRKGSTDTGRESVMSHHRQFKNKISKPIPQEDSLPILETQNEPGNAFEPSSAVPPPRPRNRPPPDPQDGTRRSSGWNRYWSGGSALQVLGFGGKRNTVASDQSSRYSQNSNSNPSRVTQDSATVPPLNFEGRTAMSRVNSGSPVVTGNTDRVPYGEAMAGKIERPSSKASSGYSSGIPESINESWDPTSGGAKDQPWGTERAPSSAYGSGFNLGSQTRPPPSGVSSQPQLAMAATSSDMSWLNLGEQRKGHNV